MGWSLLMSLVVRSAACGCRSKALAAVVQALVQGAPGRVQPLGQDVDRHLVECESDEDLSLARGEARFDLLANRGQQVLGLGVVGRPGARIREALPRFSLERQLAALPGSPPDVRGRLIEGELVGPGG